MQLSAKELLAALDQQLLTNRQKITKKPGLALVWVGDDAPTGVFVRAKQRKAQQLNVEFFLHHFEKVTERQLEATLMGLSAKKDIDGIVLQLPLPKEVAVDKMLAVIVMEKDIDGLKPNSVFIAPTPGGIIALLKHHQVDLPKRKTIILGAGPLVGAPLATQFKQHGWPFVQIAKQAEKQAEKIREGDLLIACTGVEGLVTPAMVHPKMIVVDGSGLDVNVSQIEPLVAAITPAKGAVGPLTVSYLFRNLLQAAGS